MANPPFDRPIAHRGLHDKGRGIIENSHSAFAAAIERGFGIECDLQLSADGEAIVFHDNNLERLVGRTGLVRSRLSDELIVTPLTGSSTADCPQTFEQMLAQIAGAVPLVVEVKHQANAIDTDALASRAAECVRGYQGPLVVKSFDPHMLIALRNAGYSGLLGIITYGYDKPEWYGDMPARTRFALRHLLHYPRSRFNFISCERSALGLPAVRLFKALGFRVMSWTIRSRGEAAEARQHADQIVFEGFDPDAR
ncbi:glycerophosphodiester phosphodiesterase [Pelagibacterium sp. 26DY04]|uniref:glycerophosphodiester phosphodiesterase family protein n=1 Tax=Pelagibacterium sp. 26DY04 TaxID=2967130 RepID=UPI002815FCC5|nr:glycerophosphodiester phosphodiesterase family protein [Pelagibacterium sp. 26DY04]WMT85362.1 glycerophosphodiester phosphodiesterase [Pelagibacterium sp. 26DY04]